MPLQDPIVIINAAENNLRSVSLEIPKNKLVVVTGVSGSGKSSLVFDVIYREAESRYFGSCSSHARQFMGKMHRPDVERIEGLSPAIAVDQRSITASTRSTVGTLTDIYDYLRLLFARLGNTEIISPAHKINRSLFSFNNPEGACPACNGLGVEDFLDPELLVADETKSLRDRALVITAPNGYIIYSQVTMDVLDQVCRAEGFTTDIPWKDLTPEQKHIVFYGSEKLEIPFGKHTLESRMKWSGITAKPRETGYYKGILPTMEGILKRDRNKNILRFVRTVKCSVCKGARLNEQALSVKINGWNIAGLASLQLDELASTLRGFSFSEGRKPIAQAIMDPVLKRIELLSRLGLDYLSCDRESGTLSRGEAQRLRLAVQIGTGLSNILYIFDEPSVGLHPHDMEKLVEVLRELRDQGNSVIVVEHDDAFIRQADWLVDIGPEAGTGGGNIMQNIDTSELSHIPENEIIQSHTLSYLFGREKFVIPERHRTGTGELFIEDASANNLDHIDVRFMTGGLNVVTGISGAGKSSLTSDVLGNFLQHKLSGEGHLPENCRQITGWEILKKIITIDQSPIGRTPRSNPATYTGMMDHIRDLYAGLAEVKERGWEKGRFSFNTAGGRCETCEGAGYQQVGMHFMGNVDILCEDCEGKRFNDETLSIKWEGKNIYEVLEMPVKDALLFFSSQPRIMRILQMMDALGLGYLTLGQRSGTLSGGEAQRVKLATELARPGSDHTLYILDEPTTGLHNADIKNLLIALNALVDQGNTVILVEHHAGLILAADRVIDLGPGSGKKGGKLVASGTPEEIILERDSLTGRALKQFSEQNGLNEHHEEPCRIESGFISFKGITTHNLRNIDISIPKNKITVITGVSGSGKSSLAFDTIFAEGQNRFLENFSTYVRSQVGIREKGDFDQMEGLTPALAVDQHIAGANPRSTVGTMTGIYDLYRLLYSRVAISGQGETPVLSSLFSFNHHHGACPVCDGLGMITVCDPEKLVTHPERSILNGAMDGSKTGKFYGDPFGQYVAALKTVGQELSIDFSRSWTDLDDNGKLVALYGTGETVYNIRWEYKRDERTGEHLFRDKWPGLVQLVNTEYNRKHADHRGQDMLPLMMEQECNACKGMRLNPEALSYLIGGLNIARLSAMTISDAIGFFRASDTHLLQPSERVVAAPLITEINKRLAFIEMLGLSYLTTNRLMSRISGGESQRIKLSGQLGSGLTGITYVLDEPTVGLHPSDTEKLIRMMRELQQQGNTLVVVEHDSAVILAADYVIDMGPGAGSSGGQVVSSGTPGFIMNDPASISGKYLSAEKSVIANGNRIPAEGLMIRNATAHNLNNISLEIPSGCITAVTGVSGSGKSSLVFDVIYKSWLTGKPEGCEAISGFARFRKVIAIQPHTHFSSPAGATVTYTGIFDRIRDLFAKTEDARSRQFNRNHFSWLNKEGRCPECQGAGEIRISMDFIPDIRILCESCKGSRYQPGVLECLYQQKNIAEVLALTVQQAASFFTDQKICRDLEILGQVGLGYLRLGQSLQTLSGGEAQRLTLATDLMKPNPGKCLYLFEEPATGLHFRDIELLNALFQQLADQGHTLLIIEHDPQVIRKADWIIDLGPGGGSYGGNLVAQGNPEDIRKKKNLLTGNFL